MHKIDGGRINEVYKFYDENDMKYKILKKNTTNNKILLSEYTSQLMLQTHGINVPHIYYFNCDELCMEYIENQINVDIEQKNSLIKNELTKLHAIKNTQFGNTFNTFSGNDQVSNNFDDNWPKFFNETRWKPLFDSIRNETNESDYCLALKVSDIMHKIFENINIIPSLLHGDANPQNFIISDKVYCIDSGCFFGDPNYDIACYDIWNGIVHEEPYFKLYYAYILSVSTKITPSESRYKKAKRYMIEILSQYPPFYPSLIYNLTKHDYQYVIIMCGSFNPIHLNHTNNMQIARKHCKTKHNVADECILSVYCLAEDDRVIKKDINSYLLYHRKQMCNLAIIDEHYDCAIDSTCMFGQSLIQHWKNLLRNDITIYICCGTDNIPHHVKHFDNSQLFLVNKRNKYKLTLNLNDYPNIEMIGGSEQTLSSTVIRESEHLFNTEIMLKFLNPNVLQYIQKQKLKTN